MSGVRCLAVLALAAAAAAASAADPGLEVTLEPRRFGIEDAARLEIRVLEPNGAPAVDLGALTNLQVVGGPSTTTEMSWINGSATRATAFTYTVQGVEVGAASVGPVTVRMGGHELRCEPVAAEIVPGSVAPQQPAGRRSVFPIDPFGDLMQRRQPTRSARVELRQLLDRDRVVLGQPVIARVVLDTTAGGIDGFEWVDAPSYPGWWAQRVEPPERITGEVVEVDGNRYNRFVVARHVLVPLKTGSLAVPGVGARIGFRSGSLFAPQQVVERSSPDLAVEVAARPQAPVGFAGAVGDLRYRASLEPQRIGFGESAVLSITLEGSGNLPLVEAPALWPGCSDCETYPPEEESSIAVDGRGIHGSRVWRMTLVPRGSGEHRTRTGGTRRVRPRCRHLSHASSRSTASGCGRPTGDADPGRGNRDGGRGDTVAAGAGDRGVSGPGNAAVVVGPRRSGAGSSGRRCGVVLRGAPPPRGAAAAAGRGEPGRTCPTTPGRPRKVVARCPGKDQGQGPRG